MNETTTGQVVDTSVADNSSTTDTTTNPADSQVNGNEAGNSSQATSTASAEQNQSTEADDNAALANFAKGQGITDLSELSDREISLLKMARDNKSALDRTKQNQPKLDETSKNLATLGDDATDVQKLTAKVASMEFASTKNDFFNGKDATLEPIMAQIVADKRQEFTDKFGEEAGKNYARQLLSDLPTLYGLAQLQKPADTSAAAQAAREEERSSMNQSLTASGADAHAVNSAPVSPVKVTDEWIENEYDSNNPEHRKLLDAALKR